MEVDGEEGCEGNETSLIAYQRVPEVVSAAERQSVVAFVSLPSWRQYIYGTSMNDEITFPDRFLFQKQV